MTEDVPYYVELARAAPDGPIVELAVGNGRVAVPVALETGRRVIGIDARRRCSPRLACGPSRRAPTSTSARATCATSRSTSRRRSSTARFVAPPPANMARQAARLRARSGEPRSPVGGSRGTRSASTTDSCAARRARSRKIRFRTRSARHPATTASTSSSDAGGTISLWWVTKSEWEGLIDVAGLEVEALYGWFDRRPFDDESPEFVWIARKPT